jgi:hypothetical protein
VGSLIWIASYPKSGNTWVRAFLHNVIHEKGGTLDLNALKTSARGDAARVDFERVADRPLEELGDAGIAELRVAMQHDLAKRSPGLVLVKTHTALTMIGGRPSHAVDITEAGIYLVRDPRDVAVSYADHLGREIDEVIATMGTDHAHTELGPKHVTEFMGSWSQNVATWTKPGNERVLTVRYEDLVEDPDAGFRKIVKFLNLPPDDAVFRRALKNTSFRELRRREKETGFIERSDSQSRFFRKGRAGGWRQVLTDRQAARIVEDHREQMERFGYLES